MSASDDEERGLQFTLVPVLSRQRKVPPGQNE